MFVGDAVLGQLNPEPMLNSLYQRQERERARLLKEQQDELNRQDELSKVVDASFNDKNYATGGPHDGLIRGMTAENRKKYLRMIRENPGIRLADLQYQVQNDMAKLAGMSENVKAARKQIEDTALMFKDKPGIDVNAITKLALDKMIYKTDEKGNKVLRDPDEIDPTFDYVGDAINSNKGLVINRNSVIGDFFKNSRTSEFMEDVVTDNRGKKTTWKIDAKVYDFQDFERDSKGNIIEIDGRPRIKTKSQRVDLGGGQVLEVLDEQVYSNLGLPMQLLAANEFETWNRAQKTPLDENSPEAEIMKRKFAYELLNVKPPKDKFSNKTEEDAWLAKQRSGITVNVVSPEERSAKKEEDKKNAKFNNSNIGIISNALNGNESILETAPSAYVGGTEYKDIATTSGGLVIGKDGTEKLMAKRVLVNPKTGYLIIMDNRDKKLFSGSGKEAKAWLKKMAALNDVDFELADEKIQEPKGTMTEEEKREQRLAERMKTPKTETQEPPKKGFSLNPLKWFN